ncbi:TolC family protein [Hydrogenophaga sp. MI9]|uniref:TolC family protein n=1 Tax=Hydrogenophaga sp. MI9 TaxID=3453719 RepID=UPI003EEE2C29
MTSSSFSLANHRLLAVGLLAVPWALSAQTPGPAQEADWRRANDAVGQFHRGHADVLKWEKADEPQAAPSPAAQEESIPTAEAAVRMAWRVHRDLARPLARLGTENAQLIAAGRWTELDPSLQRRVEDAGEVLEVAAAGRKAWIEAVAAQQVLKHQRDMLDAAQAAYELGQRMVTVGNWSKLQLSPVQLAASNARMNLRRAQQAAAQAQSKLVKTMGKTGLQDGFAIPDQLPAIPAQAMTESDLQKRVDAIRNQLPGAEGLRSRALARGAMKVYFAAHALAQDSQGDVLKTREFVTEETVLHYNGMLKSVWDLLDEVRNQSQATVDAIGAQRDFWIAEADLQWVLQGGEPDSFVSLGGAGGDAPTAAAH